MKNIVLLFVIFSTSIFAQTTVDTLKVRLYLDTTATGLHQYGVADTFPTNKISEDFGPRNVSVLKKYYLQNKNYGYEKNDFFNRLFNTDT